ncbi:MAG: caspase family protein [Bacteroidota bacterium]
MKKILFAIPMFVLMVSMMLSSQNAQAQAKPTKYALIIAISAYPESTGWGQISSYNDWPLIKNALLKQGFPEENIVILEDDKCNKDGIMKAMREHLINKVKPGDIAMFHYSGHGQQIADDDGDEINGYDECLVPFNANVNYEVGVYEGQNHLRDDEFGALLTEVRDRVGPTGNVLVTIDACYSGTITRGDMSNKSRGTNEKMCPPNYKPVIKETDKNKLSGGLMEKPVARGNVKVDKLAPMVVISGAKQDEPNYECRDDEGKPVGSLSYTFSKNLIKCGKSSTYLGLCDYIKSDMATVAPRQTPQIEGDVNREIFGGNAVDQAAYYKIKSWDNDTLFVMSAGMMAGIFDGSVIGLYPAGTSDPNKALPIATGVVERSTQFDCKVHMEKTIEKGNYWAFVRQQNFGDIRVSMLLSISDKVLLKKVQTDIEAKPIVKLVDKAPQLIVETQMKGKDNYLILRTPDDMIVYNEIITAEKTDEVVSKMITEVTFFARSNYLKNANLVNPDLNVEIQVVPIKTDNFGNIISKGDPKSAYTEGNQILYHDGDEFIFRVINSGGTAAYFNIIDIQPDNRINVLVPGERDGAAEYRINPGDTIELKRIPFTFGPPYGKDIFKVFASAEQIDLRPVFANLKAGTRGAMNPLEVLVSDCMQGTRGAAPSNVPTSSINVNSIVINIAEKK